MANIPLWFEAALLGARERGNSLILKPEQVDVLVKSLELPSKTEEDEADG